MPARRSNYARGLLPLLGVVVAALTVLPTTIVVAVGLLPSLVALVVDETRQRYLFRTVVGMNVAALWPFLERLWLNGNDVRLAVAIVADVYTWAALYGAAGLGWLLHMGMPSALASWQAFSARQRIAKLKKQQDQLIEEWGSALPSVEVVEKAPDKASAD